MTSTMNDRIAPPCASAPELFFSIEGETKGEETERIAKAQAICSWCPLRQSCLEMACETESVGVWGGTTEQERDHPDHLPETEELATWRAARRQGRRMKVVRWWEVLTDTEWAVLCARGDGLTIRETARRLTIREGTVTTHQAMVVELAGARSITHAIIEARAAGILRKAVAA